MKPLIVAFGGIQGKLAMLIFEFKNFLTENFEDFNFIFIRDLKQAWYTRGMDFKDLNITTKNINENIKTLNNIIGKQENSKVIFLGNSMGGFASILYGVLLSFQHTEQLPISLTLFRISCSLRLFFLVR